MNNLDLFRSVYNANSQIFTLDTTNGCISSRNKCNFKLGSELFPTIKPMHACLQLLRLY